MTKVSLTAVQLIDNYEKESRKTISKNYLEFFTVRKMIYKFLTCDRIILSPTKVSKFSELELSQKLNISLTQLRRVVQTQTYYKQIIGKINMPLIELYCDTKWEIK